MIAATFVASFWFAQRTRAMHFIFWILMKIVKMLSSTFWRPVVRVLTYMLFTQCFSTRNITIIWTHHMKHNLLIWLAAASRTWTRIPGVRARYATFTPHRHIYGGRWGIRTLGAFTPVSFQGWYNNPSLPTFHIKKIFFISSFNIISKIFKKIKLGATRPAAPIIW